MSGAGSEWSVDYAGPPPDPPPTGPELAGAPEYDPPPRPASWPAAAAAVAGQQDDSEATARRESGDSPDGGDASSTGERDDTGREVDEADQAAGEADPTRPSSGGSEPASGAVPLLRDDDAGVFRQMATVQEWEDRQLLITTDHTPPGSGEAVLAMGSFLLHWKRLLGLTVPGCWAVEYYMPSDPPGAEPPPPRFCKVLTSAWVLAGVLMVFISIGLQWALCEDEYYGRLQVWPDAVSNSSSREYLCVPSFVWTYLVPRLLYSFGYVTIFACIFCLRLPELEFIIARTYDVITEERQNPSTTGGFIAFCRRDPRLITLWFVVTHALSLVATLLGADIIRWDLTDTNPQPSSTLQWTTYISTCLVQLMMDSMMAHCILTYSLSVKYLELMVCRSTRYLQTLITLGSNINACHYLYTRMAMVVHCVRGAQPSVSAALLMAMLRVCQAASLVWLDQTSHPKRLSSLAQLPVAVMFLLLVLHHIRRHISLTETWQSELDRRPDITIEHHEEPGADPHNIVHAFSEEEEKRQAEAVWHQIVRQCPQVEGRVLGLKAAHWMYWATLVVGMLYCIGYYALLKHRPLI